MRVPEFCCHVEPEVLRVLNGGITKFDTEGSTLFKCLFEQQGFQQGIQLFCNILQKHLKLKVYIKCYFVIVMVVNKQKAHKMSNIEISDIFHITQFTFQKCQKRCTSLVILVFAPQNLHLDLNPLVSRECTQLQSPYSCSWLQNPIIAFETYWCSKLNAVFQSSHKVRVAQFDHMKVVCFLHIFHPLVCLALRINHEWPTAGIAEIKKHLLLYMRHSTSNIP